MKALLSLSADARTTSPARGSHLFTMSDGALVAIWAEGINGPGTDRVIRRYRSEDGGMTWAKLFDLKLGTLLGITDPDGSKQIFPLFSQSVSGNDTIAGFTIAVPASASYMFTMTYSAPLKDFETDVLVGSYTPTNAWDGLPDAAAVPGYTDYGKMVYDATDTDHIAVFNVLVGGQDYIYIVIWDTATGKRAEARFTNAPSTSCRYPDIAVNAASPRKIFLTYQRGNYEFRSYTWDGTTLTAADAAEVIPGTPTITGGPRCFLNNNGNLQILYENFTTTAALITRERTGVATYSAAVEIATNLPYASSQDRVGWQDQFAIIKVGTDDFYVFYKKTTNQVRGEIYYVRRIAGVWGGETAWKSGGPVVGFNHPTTTPHAVGADHKLHLLYSEGSLLYPVGWNLRYDFLYDGTPSAPTDVKPNYFGEVVATPLISATYVQNRAGDDLGKYRVLVKRDSDSTVFWDTGSGGTAWGGAAIAPGGTFSIVYAGTALVKGTVYRVEISFWSSAESYGGPLSTPALFAWNDPPSQVAVSLIPDPANGRMRIALYPLAPKP